MDNMDLCEIGIRIYFNKAIKFESFHLLQFDNVSKKKIAFKQQRLKIITQ